VPVVLKNLGLSRAYLDQHIALDIGAAALTRKLAMLLQVPAVLSNYSRLVVDCNRHLDDPSAFPEVSDGVIIPANRWLTAEERNSRADAIYWPYHAAIAGSLARLEPLSALVAIHSFTPHFKGTFRPWQVGVLWKADARISAPLLDALRADGRLNVGDNEPYSGRHPAGYTIDAHAEGRGLPHVSIEVRQDLLLTPAGVSEWAALLGKALRAILTSESVRAPPPQFPNSDSIS
jgi:predicted N-formylglutamate amidohydrolase